MSDRSGAPLHTFDSPRQKRPAVTGAFDRGQHASLRHGSQVVVAQRQRALDSGKLQPPTVYVQRGYIEVIAHKKQSRWSNPAPHVVQWRFAILGATRNYLALTGHDSFPLRREILERRGE